MAALPYPAPTSKAVTASMRGNRSQDTRPEREVRSHLHRRGRRFRKGLRLRLPDLSVRPDIVFSRARLVVFIDGCFWHQCPQHGTLPASNTDYWLPKLERNQRRDVEVTAALHREGWRVLRFWEHEPAEQVALAVERELDRPAEPVRVRS